MGDEASGWVVTVTTPLRRAVPAARVWYAAIPDKEAAVAAVKQATNDPGAKLEISREMSETLRIAFGLKSGEVRCFD
jgi:hypothetical protein